MSVAAINTICPFTGDKIKENPEPELIFSVPRQFQVAFSTTQYRNKFLIAIESFEKSTINDKEGKLPCTNSNCPWSGKPVSLKDSVTRYNGRAVGFCNAGCKDKFEKVMSTLNLSVEKIE